MLIKMQLFFYTAYRSKEITNDVFESQKSRIFDQAENRLHAQQALLSCILQ